MDFSENITGTPKYEVHLVHFNKSQYSLHVSVAKELLCKKYFFIICLMIKLITLHSLGQLPRILLHHIQILTSFDSNQTIVLSSTNQKSIWFLDWVRKDLQKPIVVYYGPWEGHGWCCQWVWCEKFEASQSQRIFFFFFEFLSQSNANDDKKVYLHITKEGISKLHNNETEITKIKENRKIHCLAFKPDGRIIVQYKLTWKLFYTIMITVMLMM